VPASTSTSKRRASRFFPDRQPLQPATPLTAGTPTSTTKVYKDTKFETPYRLSVVCSAAKRAQGKGPHEGHVWATCASAPPQSVPSTTRWPPSASTSTGGDSSTHTVSHFSPAATQTDSCSGDDGLWEQGSGIRSYQSMYDGESLGPDDLELARADSRGIGPSRTCQFL